MESKIIEIRDSMTCIGAVAILLSREDGYLAQRSGYGEPCVLLTRLQGGKACYDCYEWGDRTMTQAHNYIQKNWKSLKSGDVVDVEYILGETSTPKRPEREETYAG